MHLANTLWNRRRFLKAAGLTAAMVRTSGRSLGSELRPVVAVVLDPTDEIAGAQPAKWAAEQLSQALTARGITATRCARIEQAESASVCILVSGAASAVAASFFAKLGVVVAEEPESLAIASTIADEKRVLLACGHDVRGVVYALLELADRVQNTSNPVSSLIAVETKAERAANQVRSVTRLFTSEIEDKPWYNDREMWPRYLDMLATQRFNRFNLAFGIGYDFIRNVTDAYFLFAYPFLLSVPGYDVHVPQLPDSERDNNLEMLQYISEQATARGLEFYLGLWMHGYVWTDSPNANYTVQGLTRETHGPYCGDAVRRLLKGCPNISGLTFRIHGESGVEEGSYDFWKSVFSGVASCGRKVNLDMHTKGMDETMIQIALATSQPVNMSPKFWAEHLGMPYHQADIRTLEQPKLGSEKKTGLMKLSDGTRSFLRYGYGDLLPEDRRWTVVHRIWPGTQRLLLWGDPQFAGAYSKAFNFCGSNGVEICEPLSFKGRRGSGIFGGRCGYADATLKPRWDWQKYEYSYRVWGRLLYNPDCNREVLQRPLKKQFGPGAKHLEAALANVSRILPIVTTAHAPSAGNNTYWPEMYLNQSMIDGARPGPYMDTPSPKVFGNVSPLDPQLFSSINSYADDILRGERSGKYSPIEVAQWIEDYAESGRKHLAQADTTARGRHTPAYRRMKIDIQIQIGLGQFFAAKFRSGVLFRIYEVSGDRSALEFSLSHYRKARAAWASLANLAKGVYMSDITIGEQPQLRGHWHDRLPAVDADIAALTEKLNSSHTGASSVEVKTAIQEALGRPTRRAVTARHNPPALSHSAQPLTLTLVLERRGAAVRLYYRHVDQAERYQECLMESKGLEYSATIPAGYTDSRFPLEYYFEVRENARRVSLFPGFDETLTRQPYFVVRRS